MKDFLSTAVSYLSFNLKRSMTSIFGVFVGFILAQLGGYDVLLSLMFTFIVGDIVSGLGVAFFVAPFDFNKLFFGMFKKAMMVYLVILGVKIDLTLGTSFVREGMIGFVCSYEGLSMLNNYDLMGLPAPSSLKSFMIKLRDKADNMILGGVDSND